MPEKPSPLVAALSFLVLVVTITLAGVMPAVVIAAWRWLL